MRLLAFTDTHGDMAAARSIHDLVVRGQPDCIVSSGDLSFCGEKHEDFLGHLSALQRQIYFVPGNHDPADVCRRIEEKFPFMVNVSYRCVEFQGIWIVGLPGTDDIAPGGPEDEGAFQLAMDLWGSLAPSMPIVMLTHYAPWGTRCDGLKRRPGESKPIDLPSGDGGGSRIVRKIIDRLQPDVVVCGHYHLSFGERDQIKRSQVLNPGPMGAILEIPTSGRAG